MLRLIGRVNQPACGVVRESEEDAERGALKLLIVGDKFIAESWFITFEEGGTAKDSEVCDAVTALHATVYVRTVLRYCAVLY